MKPKMTMVIVSIFVLIPLFMLGTNLIHAAEHPGEHPGEKATEANEQSGDRSGQATPDDHSPDVGADQIKSAITEYIDTDQRLKNGFFYIHDEQLDRDWKLRFDTLHPVRTIERGGQTIYFACSDFSVVGSDEYNTADLDFWMELNEGELEPMNIRIHKIDGNERFTYQDDEPVQTSP